MAGGNKDSQKSDATALGDGDIATQAQPIRAGGPPQPISPQGETSSAQNGAGQNGGSAGSSHGDKQEVVVPGGVERTKTGKVYVPSVDIYETNDSIVLIADMPGVDDRSVNVSLEKNVLTIYGHVEPNYPAGHNLIHAEYGLGDYQRSFTISNEVDWEAIEGSVRNGVLKITLPKAGPTISKKISIRSA
ncbi:MAG: Hsp20/alpha crystallin family protein [Chloroflexota bacterium]|nr:Hsp20/alpha crystallin family protein [Chloroflexota bacterium]